MSLYVVFVPKTGHVVGALNAIGVARPAEATAPVGDALPLRVSLGPGEVASLSLPATELAVHEADDEPAVFADPLAFAVEQVEDADPKPALTRPPRSTKELELGAGGLHVAIDVPNESQVTRVIALVSEGQDTHSLAGEIPIGRDHVRLPVTVSPGSHGVLVLVAGWAGRLEKVEQP